MRAACWILAAWASGCGGDGPADSSPAVTREVLRVAGAQPAGTPDEFNASHALIFSNGGPVDAVIVAMPGFLGGGNAFRPLAEQLVARGGMEVWAVDRRGNLLEDLHGVRAETPAQVAAYYRDGGAVLGRTFAGFRKQADLQFMKEWGLAVHAADLKAVIDAAGDRHPQARIYLAGHSLGASFAEAYAGFELEGGQRGAAGLSGLILLDGVLGAEPITEEEHATELAKIKPFLALPLLGVQVYATLLVAAARALADPGGVVDDPVRDGALSLLLSTADMPRLTNRAVVGFALDDEFNPLPMLWTKLGGATGGPVEEYDNPLGDGRLLRPTDKDATYDWVAAADSDPAELTPIDNVARTTADAEADFAEWYFPARLPLDLSAQAPGEVALPVLSIPAGLFPGSMAAVRERMAEAVPFTEVDARHMAHVDVLVAADLPENPIPDAVAQFVR